MSIHPALKADTLSVPSPKHTALKIAAIYASISAIWILFSDQLLSIVVKDIGTITWIQMFKGWFFILATSYLIFLLLRRDIQKHSRVQQALKLSQEQLLSLMEALPVAISWADEQGNIQYNNNKFIELFGYTVDDMPGIDNWFRMAYPDSDYRQTVVSKWLAAVESARNSGSATQPIEVSITCKDNSTRQVEIIGKTINHQILAVFNDLTDSIQAKKALEESEYRYRTLFDSANDGILILKDDICIEGNKKALDMFGCNPEELVGQHTFRFSPPYQPDGRSSTDAERTKTSMALQGKPQVFEWQHKRFNDDLFDTEVSLSLFEIGSEKYIQSILRDISERKKLDKELQFLRRWVEQSVDLIFWVSKDSRVLYVNRAVCELLGYSFEEFCAMRVGDFDLKLPSEAWPAFTKRLKKQGSYRFETRLKSQNGTVFPVEITANTLKFENKDYFIAYGRDIRARIQAENERKALESRLLQAQKLEAIGTLAGGIAHDFNNILFPMSGYTELMMEDVPEESPLQEYLHSILANIKRASDLVKQILAFSRSQEYQQKPIQVKTVIKEALRLIRASLPSTIRIDQGISEDCRPVLADPTQIHQVAMNLLTNAFHAMEDKGGTLTVTLGEVDRPTRQHLHDEADSTVFNRLTVADTGTGMKQEVIDRIFDPYFTTKSEGKGTGLGLAVVHGIVKNHGGFINVGSEPGKGTVFEVFLPVVQKEPALEEVSDQGELPGGTERILLVDDEQPIVAMLAKMLTRLGYDVRSRTSSAEALSLFQSDPDAFDLVIADMTMPVLTGDELAVKLLELRPHLPIILCSGFSQKMTPKIAGKLGIKGFLMKPVVRNDLARLMRQALDHRQQG